MNIFVNLKSSRTNHDKSGIPIKSAKRKGGRKVRAEKGGETGESKGQTSGRRKAGVRGKVRSEEEERNKGRGRKRRNGRNLAGKGQGRQGAE